MIEVRLHHLLRSARRDRLALLHESSSVTESASSRFRIRRPRCRPRHHRADRDVEDLRGVLVAEVADVDEHDRIAEVVRHGAERRHDVILRQAFDDAPLPRRNSVGTRRACRRGSSRSPRAPGSGARAAAAAAVDVQVREDAEQPRAQVRARLYERQLRNARAYVSCTRSSASSWSRRGAARRGTPGRRARAPPLRTERGRAPPQRSVLASGEASRPSKPP